MKDFSRSQVVTYTVKVVISRKQCKIDVVIIGSNKCNFTASDDLVYPSTSFTYGKAFEMHPWSLYADRNLATAYTALQIFIYM